MIDDRVRLAGAYEIQVLLRVSRQRAYQISSGPTFPDPLAKLDQGHVWAADEVEEWVRLHRRRRPGSISDQPDSVPSLSSQAAPTSPPKPAICPGRVAWQSTSVLEKPEVADSVLADGVRDGWGLPVTGIAFVPVGLDGAAWAYEVSTADGRRWFLKVRAGAFAPQALRLPSCLRDRGLPQVVAPIGEVRAVGGWWLALYPFADGADLWDRGLTDRQWVAYGRFLGALHAVELPPDVAGLLPIEAYASTASRRVRALAGPVLEPYRERLDAWTDELDRLERDAAAARAPVVVCHTDIHPGNLLADGDDVRVVDWDAPMWAPKERDLMFVFGTDFGAHPIDARREALFRSGYGPLELDDPLLDYYRLERRLDDIALFAATVLDESASETARAHELGLLTRLLES